MPTGSCVFPFFLCILNRKEEVWYQRLVLCFSDRVTPAQAAQRGGGVGGAGGGGELQAGLMDVYQEAVDYLESHNVPGEGHTLCGFSSAFDDPKPRIGFSFCCLNMQHPLQSVCRYTLHLLHDLYVTKQPCCCVAVFHLLPVCPSRRKDPSALLLPEAPL